MGTIYNSKFRSGPYIEMHRKLENEIKIKNDTPGPGSYIRFSEFGIWVPKHLSRSQNIRKRLKTENNSDNKIKNYFRKKMMERIKTVNPIRNTRTLTIQ